MKRMMNARLALLLAVALATGLLLCGCGKAENAVDRIGVYDSRSIAVAWAGTEPYNNLMKSLQAEWQQAKAAGDQKKVEEVEAEAEAQQRLLHMQAFSTAPVDDILAHIEDSLAEIKKEAGVTMLVSKWDTETLAQYPSAEQIDVTMMLVDALHPNERQRQTAITIQESEPIPLDQAEQIKDW
jgi:hypothetical protein